MRLSSKSRKPAGKAPRCVLNVSKAVHLRFKGMADARGLKLMRAGDMALIHYLAAGMPPVVLPEEEGTDATESTNGGGK